MNSRASEKFGNSHLYSWWRRACSNLGFKGIDLYGGTRHSSAIALTEFATPEQIKRATMHSANQAFERYYRIEKNDLKNLYTLTNHKGKSDQRVTNQKGRGERSK